MSAGRRGLTLRRLAITGGSVEPAAMEFSPGLNVVYGASNTGKSSLAQTLDFMLGGSEWLKPSDENKGYEAGWLGLDLPGGQQVTLYRSVRGGHFRLYDGLVTGIPAASDVVLKEKHDPKSTDNLSMFLMNAIGFGVREVVKNSDGKKQTISFRNLSPYVIVEEGPIIETRSPVHGGQRQDITVEKNILKVILTGRDDAAVVPAPDGKELKTRNSGKIELIVEMLAEVDAALGEASNDREGAARQAASLRARLEEWTADIRRRQGELDAAVAERRAKLDAMDRADAHRAELAVTVGRFEELDRVYASDLERLESLEENSFLLKTMNGLVCPTCGAPEHEHREGPGREEIERFHLATAAEMRKVERERRDLQSVIESLRSEAAGLANQRNALAAEAKSLDDGIVRLRREEASSRERYEELIALSERAGRVEDLFSQRDRLAVQKAQLEAPSASRVAKPSLVHGVDGVTAFAFAKVIERVLSDWSFPGRPQVSWNDAAQDIYIDGKERSANGKGVRAVLHSAFKVGLMIFCHEKGLPHPGFVVLDTPLLTYRGPMESKKHPEVEPDEAALKNTSLKECFYDHLAGLADIGQVIVLENSDPPEGIEKLGKVTVFTKRTDPGLRYGLFPI